MPVLPDIGGPPAAAEDGGELGAQSPLAGRPGLLGQPHLHPWLQHRHDAGVTQECPDLPPAHAAAVWWAQAHRPPWRCGLRAQVLPDPAAVLPG